MSEESRRYPHTEATAGDIDRAVRAADRAVRVGSWADLTPNERGHCLRRLADLFVFTRREPLDVVAAVVPWNSQLFLSAVKIGPVLAAGNTVVLKASEFASAAMLEFGRLVDLANDTRHGLAAGIFTRDSARSLRLAQRIRAGIVSVNTYRAVSPIAEFGGIKTSGYGRESGLLAVYDYTRPQTVWMNTSSEVLPSQFVAR